MRKSGQWCTFLQIYYSQHLYKMCFFLLSKTTFSKHVFISQVQRKERKREEKEGIRERRRRKGNRREDKREGSPKQMPPWLTTLRGTW